MEKVKFAPIDPINYEANYQEFTKEELEAAGIIIDYEDEKISINTKPKTKTPKHWIFNNYIRWILLSVLVLYITIIINIGMTRINEKEQIGATNQVPATNLYGEKQWL